MTLPPNDPILTLSNPSLYLNRELSMLEFQRRLLEEVHDESNPLLERVKFLAIFGSNMDEFFMVRVSGIRRQVEARILEVSPDGMTPRDELAAIRKVSNDLYADSQLCWHKKLLPRLEKTGIHVLDYARLNASQKEKVDTYFREVVFPVLTPLALDPGHPFPHISNLSLNLAIVIRDPKGNEKFVIKAGAMPNVVMDDAGVKALATLPSREELLATKVRLTSPSSERSTEMWATP